MRHGITFGDVSFASLDVVKNSQFFKKQIDIDIAAEGVEHCLYLCFFHEIVLLC